MQPKAKYSQQKSWITQCMLRCRRIWCMFFMRGLPTSILADTSLGTWNSVAVWNYIIARQSLGQNSTNIGPYLQTNTWVSNCAWNSSMLLARQPCFSVLHTLALAKVQLESINVLQRKMLRSIVGWVRVNGEDWSETMRRMNHRLSVALELFPIPPWTEQLAKRQFQFAAKIASEQSWSSIAGHWICTTGWQANFDNMPSRKRGRPLVKWDDKLSHLTHQFFPLHSRWLVAAKFPFWQNARQFFVSHFVDL